MSFVVAQLGARMHYAIPHILESAGQLEYLYTDFCAAHGWPKAFKMLPRVVRPLALKRMLGRVPKGIPPEKIKAFNLFGLNYAQKLRRCRTPEERTRVFLWSGKRFCQRVLNHGFGSADSVYTYNTAGLEILQTARSRGLRTILEQTIAPKQVEMELLRYERESYPTWEPDGGLDSLAQEFAEREFAEWTEAEIILCACEFVREGIRQCGGPVGKCVVVPYGVDLPQQTAEVRSQKLEVRNRPLRVLTVGAVGLRKGSPYVLAAAKQLKGKAVFRMVGSLGVTAQAEIQLREQLELTGLVPRSEIANHFRWADVFLLPSICEGSATVTYEALGHGLPVLCTPNTGSVVRDGVDGFIMPARNVEVIVAQVSALAADPALLRELGVQAKARAQDYTVREYGRRLIAAL